MKKIVFIFLIFCIGGILIFAFTPRVRAENSCSKIGPCGECNATSTAESCCDDKKDMCEWIGDKGCCCPKLEVDWPSSPAKHNINGCSTLPELIRYLYEWGIGIGGLVLFVALVWAGISMMMSVGKPAAWQDAKNRMASALIGMGLLLGSYLILNFINPELTQLRVPDITELIIKEICAECNSEPSPQDCCTTEENSEHCTWDKEKGKCHVRFSIKSNATSCTAAVVYKDKNFEGDSDSRDVGPDWTEIDLTGLSFAGWGETPIRSLELRGPDGISCLEKTKKCKCEVEFYENPGCDDNKFLFSLITPGVRSLVSAKEPVKCIKVRQLASY